MMASIDATSAGLATGMLVYWKWDAERKRLRSQFSTLNYHFAALVSPTRDFINPTMNKSALLGKAARFMERIAFRSRL
jgi:hypothetical protein